MGFTHESWLVICLTSSWLCCLLALGSHFCPLLYYPPPPYCSLEAYPRLPCSWGSGSDLGPANELQLHEVWKVGVRQRGLASKFQQMRVTVEARLQVLASGHQLHGSPRWVGEWGQQGSLTAPA